MAGMRPVDSGSILLAGLLKGLERSNSISLKTVPGSGWLLWVAGIYSRLVVVLCCCHALGVPWGFQVVPILSYLETSTHLPPLLWLLSLQPPPPRRALLPASEPVAGMIAACVQRNWEVYVGFLRNRPEKWPLPSVCWWRCSGQDLKCPSLTSPRKFILWLLECTPLALLRSKAVEERENEDRPVSLCPLDHRTDSLGSWRLLASSPCIAPECLSFYCPI